MPLNEHSRGSACLVVLRLSFAMVVDLDSGKEEGGAEVANGLLPCACGRPLRSAFCLAA